MVNVITNTIRLVNDMKIVLYGISRAGKDTLISRLIDSIGNQLTHIKGSSTLKDLAKKLYHQELSNLSPYELNHLRTVFMEKLRLYDSNNQSIIVDGHFSFPNNEEGFNIVFTDFDLHGYDVFVYMKRSPKTILRNARTSPNHPHMKYLEDEELVKKWINFEVSALEDICKKHNKNFILLDDDAETSERFLIDLIRNPETYLSKKVANSLIEKLNKKMNKFDQIILVDCDKTVSVEDQTYAYANSIGIEKNQIKEIFIGDQYTVYQFYKFHRLMDQRSHEKNILSTSNDVGLNSNLINDIHNHNHSKFVIGITTGLGLLWQNINKDHHIFDMLIGCQCNNDEHSIDSYITPCIKGEITLALKEKGYKVKAIGDSIIDIEMLIHADEGYIISHLKTDSRLEKYLEYNRDVVLYQLSYNQSKYSRVKEVTSIW